MNSPASVPPEELRLAKARDVLQVLWQGARAELGAEYLRVESPSAEVKGHGPGDARLVSGKRGVTIEGLEQVGNYAVKISFNDGHRTGIYTWEYLKTLADEFEERWAAYERDLSAAGLGRDKAGPVVLRRDLR
ncbi:MAG: DUF971 domain-containing protein [Proteobacteria bacterium]|nr:DUF971 domain-containing protein [Pseudomonadota bacterium]